MHGNITPSPSTPVLSLPFSQNGACTSLPSYQVPTVAAVPEDITSDWQEWSARRRMVGLRRWIMDVEWTHGTLQLWNLKFADEWANISRQPTEVSSSWLALNEGKARIGRLVLGYLGRVMDGQISGDVEEWRDLSLQIQELAASLHQAVVGLEVSLRWVRLSPNA